MIPTLNPAVIARLHLAADAGDIIAESILEARAWATCEDDCDAVCAAADEWMRGEDATVAPWEDLS